jgi:hypothetical protein
MTFWQGLAISVLAQTLNETSGDPEEWATKSQNFLICLEMLIFSLAHYYCFPTNEWQEDYKVNYQQLRIGDSIALGDFFSDLKLVMKRQAKNKLKNKNKKKNKHLPSQPTVEEVDEENVADDQTTDSDDQTADDASLNTIVSVQSADTDRKETDEAQKRLGKFLDDMTFASSPRGEDMKANNKNTSLVSPLRPSLFAADTTTSSSEVATEQTGLLASSEKKTLTPLKPSIFTNMADIAERSISSADEQAPMEC